MGQSGLRRMCAGWLVGGIVSVALIQPVPMYDILLNGRGQSSSPNQPPSVTQYPAGNYPILHQSRQDRNGVRFGSFLTPISK